IPYSMGVNVGSYANTARGSLTQGKSISGASWKTGTARSVDDITRANPGVVTTTSNHGYSTGDFVWISGVSGMTQINDRAFRVVKTGNKTFTLESWNGSSWSAVKTRSTDGYSSYSSGGTIQPCQVSDCSVVVTANGHGLSNSDYVYITGVSGMTQINNAATTTDPSRYVQGYRVANVTTNTYSIGYNGASWGSYSSGGTSYCGQDGCEYRVFVNQDGDVRRLNSSTCVSERTGSNAYTSTYTSSSKVGRNYPAASDQGDNGCPSSQLTPLSASRSSLHTLINNMAVGGSTAGQIGMAWGWYSISPSFNAMWPSSSAGALNDDDILKAVVFMTDGEFNTPYCSGVIAQDSGSGSGGTQDHISCNATNGDPFTQTLALCSAIKAQGIIIYTVGFSVASGGQAANVMAQCATSADYAFLP
ncbi:MAG: pilus assembly protein TadG, partial [Brevundimonas sp.]